MTTHHRTAAAALQTASHSYWAFGQAMRNWLLRANRSQKELAFVVHVDPSTVTNWVKGHKRPDRDSLVRILAAFKGWLGDIWDPREPLDAVRCLGYDWYTIQEVLTQRFEKGGLQNRSGDGGKRHNRPSAVSSCRRAPSYTSRARSNSS